MLPRPNLVDTNSPRFINTIFQREKLVEQTLIDWSTQLLCIIVGQSNLRVGIRHHLRCDTLSLYEMILSVRPQSRRSYGGDRDHQDIELVKVGKKVNPYKRLRYVNYSNMSCKFLLSHPSRGS